ncbi:hypothetical protein FVE85_9265 [Porphyridium purpureum]|uniref:Uncharacterized protein n=1 Tax=Porphyridium purpureum TaxID=35688 RepID=A0A5J4YQD8_PORPP|nr:hypothetical protein FVE85_9265 [Porphyridium purpureum]|eukprot:POR2891..scf222_8
MEISRLQYRLSPHSDSAFSRGTDQARPRQDLDVESVAEPAEMNDVDESASSRTGSENSAQAMIEKKRRDFLNRLLLCAYQIVLGAAFVAYELPVMLSHLLYRDTASVIGIWVYGLGFFLLLPVCVVAIIGSLRHEALQKIWERRHLPETPEPPTRVFFLRLVMAGVVAVFPVKIGKRRYIYGTKRHFPWMTLLIVCVWVLLFVVNPPGSGGIYSFCDFDARCNGTALTFCNLIANFLHSSTGHLFGNISGLCLFSLITELSYGSWRAYLPVLSSVPWLLPIYGQCNSIGGSGILGLLAGNFVAVWTGELAWAGRLCDMFSFCECISAGLMSVFVANFAGVLSSLTSTSNIAHWVHASAQILGFCMSLILLPSFDHWAKTDVHDREHDLSGDQSAARQPPYVCSVLWTRWFSYAAALLGVLASCAFLCVGFLVG